MKRFVHFIMMIAAFAGGAAAARFIKKDTKREEAHWKERADKFKTYYEVTTEWIQTMQNGGCIREYFEKNKYRKVVIYGKGLLGELLYDEISKAKELEVICFVDKQSSGESQYGDEIPTIMMEELKDKEYDIIVVTPVFAYSEIKQELQEIKRDSQIVSLQDVVIESR